MTTSRSMRSSWESYPKIDGTKSQTKSFLTDASHWIDDFFDSPETSGGPVSYFFAIGAIYAGRSRNTGVWLVQWDSRWPAACRIRRRLHKTLHRMLMEDSWQRSHDHAERQQLCGNTWMSLCGLWIPRVVEAIGSCNRKPTA